MATKLTGDYAFNLLFPAIDYCGNIKSGSNIYNPNFSPNNIKRVILSPNGVTVTYHLGVKGNKSRTIHISPSILSQVSELEDYKPIINIISDHICSSIEEIILCGQSNDGQYSLSYKDLDWEGLIKTYKNNKENLIETFKGRYLRLRYIVILPSMSYNSLMSLYENNKTYFFGDNEEIKSQGEVQEFHGEDEWYMSYGHSSSYSLDASGSKLNNYFIRIKNEKLEANKKDKIDKYKDKILGEELKEQEKALKEYTSVYNCYKKLCVMTQKSPNALLSYSLDRIEMVELYKVKGIEDYNNVKVKGEISEKDCIKQNIKTLKGQTIALYKQLLSKFEDNMRQFTDYSNLLNIVVEENTGIHTFEENEGVYFANKIKDANIKTSVINICALFTLLFISNVGDKPTKKYRDKLKWEEEF